jgi:hypothetical protein
MFAFLVGAYKHGRAIIAGGWLPYDSAPFALNLFWTALLPVDILVAVLLGMKLRAGVWLGVIVMVADVAVNSWTMSHFNVPGLPSALQLQTLFLGFVLGSAPLLLSGIAARPARRR